VIESMQRIKRRDFIRQTAGGIGGILLARSLSSNVILAQASGMSKVIVARHPNSTDGIKAINAANVQAMMDESIKQITGKNSVSEAWASILPGFKKEHIVAVKVNTITPTHCTHPEVVNAVLSGLTAIGVPENNIIVFDRINDHITACGYKHNAGGSGVRYFGNDEDGWGYDVDKSVDILGQKIALSHIIKRCDHLINIPALRVHLDPYGVTLSLKNHYGSIDNPQTLHDNFASACAILNSQNDIRDKTRLIVIDALFGFWGSNNTMFVQDFAPNSLIISKDPVAADYVGTEMLNEERAKHNEPPRRVPLLEKAAQIGLGTNEPQKIEPITLDL